MCLSFSVIQYVSIQPPNLSCFCFSKSLFSSFGFIASPLAAYRLLKGEFWGLLGDFLESSCQPNRKSPLISSFRFLFPTFSVRLSQQQASGLAFFHRSSLAVCPSGHAPWILLWTCNHFLVTSSRLSVAF